MKYLIFIVLLSSCAKSYTCECRTPTGGYLTNTSQVTGSVKDATAECKETEQYFQGVKCELR